MTIQQNGALTRFSTSLHSAIIDVILQLCISEQFG
jgi:hypothetical protein